jgi:hypothetical protein
MCIQPYACDQSVQLMGAWQLAHRPCAHRGRAERAARRALAAAGCAVEVHAVPGKAGGMVAGAGEMRTLMAFWARTLSAAPAAADAPGGAGSVVEVTDPAAVQAVVRDAPPS